MAKQYTLSESDRALLSRALQGMRASPPRPTVARIEPNRYETADSWWVLPPCETGLPGRIAVSDYVDALAVGSSQVNALDASGIGYGSYINTSVWACLYTMSVATGVLEPVRYGDGSNVKVLVWNGNKETINTWVQVVQAKNGVWHTLFTEDALAAVSTTSTSPNPNNPPSSPLCYGDCFWVSKPLGGGNFAWVTPPGGNCRNTTTNAPATSNPNNPSSSTSSTTTTQEPCQAKPKCKLRCVARPTTTHAPGGTTVWPPQPTWDLIYETMPWPFSCNAPCTCYGSGDPCLELDGVVDSKCLFVPTSTTSTTTTAVPPSRSPDPCAYELAGPPAPGKYVAAKLTFGTESSGWKTCVPCQDGSYPIVTETESLRSIETHDAKITELPAVLRFLGWHYERVKIDSGEIVFDTHKPSWGRWRFESGCVQSPCYVGDPSTATEMEAEYRAFNRVGVYRYIINNAISIFGFDWLWREYFNEPARLRPEENFNYLLSNPIIDTTAADFLWREMYIKKMGSGIGQLQVLGASQSLAFLVNEWLDWRVCKTCPPGYRPAVPPSPYNLYRSRTEPEIVDGTLDAAAGVRVYKTPCIPGPPCDACSATPIYITPIRATGATESSTTTQEPCGCYPPTYCPSAAGECTRTLCAPGGKNVDVLCAVHTTTIDSCYDPLYAISCNCKTTTTAAPAASTTTGTTLSPTYCIGNTNCVFKSYTILDNRGNPSGYYWERESVCSEFKFGTCVCNDPASPPTDCGLTTQTPCTRPTTVPPGPPTPPCNCSGRGCFWVAAPGGKWRRMYGSVIGSLVCPPLTLGVWWVTAFTNPDGTPTCCSAEYDRFSNDGWGCSDRREFVNEWVPTGTTCEFTSLGSPSTVPLMSACRSLPASLCSCLPPNYPSTGCERAVFTPCVSHTTPAPCACCYGTTTTTTVAPCLSSCIYKGNGSGGWTLLTNPCQASCLCPAPQGPSKDECDRMVLRCGSQPSTTSSTTSTSTTPVPLGRCCYSSYNPSGCIEVTAAACAQAGGSYGGNNTVCSSGPCPATTTTTTTTTTPIPRGRCCVGIPLTCFDNFLEADCFGGTWAQGATCAESPCPTTTTTTTTPAPLGRCCWGPFLSLCSNGYTSLQCLQETGLWAEGQTCQSAPCTTTTSAPTTIPPA